MIRRTTEQSDLKLYHTKLPPGKESNHTIEQPGLLSALLTSLNPIPTIRLQIHYDLKANESLDFSQNKIKYPSLF